MRRLSRSVLAGAVAGAVGTLCMDLVWYRRFRQGGGTQAFAAWETSAGTSGYEDAPAPARTAKAIADQVGIQLADSTARNVNNAVHWLTGIGWGKAHGLVTGVIGSSNPLLGLGTAVTAWATSYAVLPKLGVYEEMSQYSKEVLWQDLSAHLAYGAVLGIAYRILAPAPASFHQPRVVTPAQRG